MAANNNNIEENLNDGNEPPTGDENVVPDDGTTGDGEGNEPPPPVAAGQQSGQGGQNLTPRERELMNLAASREKKKLYADIEKLKKTVADLQQQLSSAQSGNGRGKKSNDDDAVVALRDELRAMREELLATQRAASVLDYKRRVIEEARRARIPFVEALVVGDSEEMIDLAFEVAKAEASSLLAMHGQATEVVAPRTTVVSQGAPRRPAGVPRVPVRPASGAETEDSVSIEEIRSWASPESLRNGTWAQHRNKAIAALQQGKIRTA